MFKKSIFLLPLLLFSTICTFSDIKLRYNMCSILHETCEWRRNDWSTAIGIRRKLDVGKPTIQFFYFCHRKSIIENCNQWVDENNNRIENGLKKDQLIGNIFVIENLGVNTTGDYFKLPENPKNNVRLVIE